MNWETLSTTNQLKAIIAESTDHPVMIFKHSTRCSISSMALNRLERSWNQDEINPLKPYYLDLIAYREVSNQIAADLGVEHQSPQVLILSDGKAIYDNSHMGISYNEILKIANDLQTA
ncbi:bacillithiol system redox-active protein YtxJ [Reichenbachiella agarivorans]|uniref:Bacillithiol system redox-active protein YtxJ n=1 Tax=Reichenbachiella agarivorans TaxID=2979464 RepID=A0ABY6CTR7_9BACT|nr:bacillithiol system redox-active protein YtxJ [Reichenbachiella agarivorans]UXP33901.1 bacillithiol system redox-active protein YtxJ [Reichenbachiella agarivorans]